MKKIILIAALMSFSTIIFSQEKTYTLTQVNTGKSSVWGAIPLVDGQIIFVANEQSADNDNVLNSKLYVLNSQNAVSELPAFAKYQRIGSPFISDDGKEFYFTVSGTSASTSKGGWLHPDLELYPLQILISKIGENGEWAEPVAFQHNGNNFSNGDPCLSPDGQYLYFASNREGSSGGTDIYRSKRNSDGSWDEPQNVRIINSYGDERFPRFDTKGNLYFSSTAGSAGSLDLFVFPLNSDNFTKPERLEYPLNSDGDDFAISFIDEKSGYLSSNRDGEDYIYFFEVEKPKIQYDTVRIIETVQVAVEPEPEPVRPDLLLEDMLKSGKMKYIYFDFDRYNIRNKEIPALTELLIFMRQYPTVVLELPSYADCRGNDSYNLRLADNRGEAVKNYLVTTGGIDASRITVKGYGSINPVNECGDCTKAGCDEEQFEANRRVEYRVLKY
ncbi:MAG: OmpA family protein [Prevotellaceae bacterium]|jgi:outer membrane protein OmpA-like peptidoglycan-associated protein|nr:OmpA family protein [Prevotellaceae bacterium]